MLSNGDTVGVFQLESSGMRDVLRGLKPDRFEDIIAVVALYRPGPMENIKDYVARKHDPSQITYMHPDLEPVLAETYGIMIYQEQVKQGRACLLITRLVLRIFCAVRWVFDSVSDHMSDCNLPCVWFTSSFKVDS